MLRPLRVLLVEDNLADAELIQRALRRGGFDAQVTRVDTEKDFVANLHAGLDVVLSDYEMPQFSGLRALELLKESGQEIPFILVSGTIGEETAVGAMRLGAADYLLKDRLTRLETAIHHALEKGLLRRERQLADERLREQAQILDWAAEAIIVRDVQTRQITFWNQGAERLYGWSANEAIGRTTGFSDFLESNEPTDMDAQLLRNNEWQGELRQATKQGLSVIISSHATLVRDAAGQPKSVLMINIDMTERRQLEAQLRRAQRLESIGALASGLAHDLNNTITPIMMCAPLLRRDLPPGRAEAIISMIETSGERATDIIKRVLTFSRGSETERRPVPLHHLMGEMVKVAQATFPKSIVVESAHSADLWEVIADPTQLHQVLMNLCVNARDAMPEGGTLQLTACNAEVDPQTAARLPEGKPGTYAVVEVSDTGTGVAPELLEKIFEPFFTTKDEGKGSGLGLASVREIVKNHGGFIEVQSTLGKGTIFKTYLPAVLSAAPAESAEASASAPEGNGETILFVDDEASVTAMARLVLETHGYRVLSAGGGAEALALYAQNRDDIAAVLIDVAMPLMDGQTVVRALRRMNPEVRTIASSGHATESCLAELRLLRVAALLQKPYSAHALLTVLDRVLRGEKAPSQPSGESLL